MGLANEESACVRKPARGRPVGTQKRSDVADRLMDAAEGLLQTVGLGGMTERRIATEAGVHEKMIHYYFGTKDGLVSSVLERYAGAVVRRYESLRDNNSDWHRTNPTRQIFTIFIDSLYDKPVLARTVLSAVLQEDSGLRAIFLQRYGFRGLNLLREIVGTLVERGIYRRDIDVGFIALTFFSMIVSPLILSRLSTLHTSGMTLERFRADPWLDHLVALIDAHVLARGAGQVGQEGLRVQRALAMATFCNSEVPA